MLPMRRHPKKTVSRYRPRDYNRVLYGTNVQRNACLLHTRPRRQSAFLFLDTCVMQGDCPCKTQMSLASGLTFGTFGDASAVTLARLLSHAALCTNSYALILRCFWSHRPMHFPHSPSKLANGVSAQPCCIFSPSQHHQIDCGAVLRKV